MDIYTEKHTPFVILSAERAEKSAVQNCVNTAALAKALEESAYDYAQVTGRYEGKQEKAFIVLAPLGRRDPAYQFCLTQAHKWEQESLLFVTETCKAFLDYLPEDVTEKPTRTPIGHWRLATPTEAAAAAAITIDANGTPWIAANDKR